MRLRLEPAPASSVRWAVYQSGLLTVGTPSWGKRVYRIGPALRSLRVLNQAGNSVQVCMNFKDGEFLTAFVPTKIFQDIQTRYANPGPNNVAFIRSNATARDLAPGRITCLVIVLVLMTGFIWVYWHLTPPPKQSINFTVASRSDSVQLGERTLDERLILTGQPGNLDLVQFVKQRTKAALRDGFAKIFVYAYPSETAYRASPVSWRIRAMIVPADGDTEPRIDFNDPSLMSGNLPSPASSSSAFPTGGKWQVENDKSAMDDSQTVSLTLQANASIKAWLKTPTPVLVVQCDEHRTEVFVQTDTAANPVPIDGFPVRLRFDNEKAYFQVWKETSDHAALYAANAVALAKRIAKAKTMRFEFTPLNSQQATAEFDVRGLSQVLPNVAKACGWNR